MPSCLMPRAVAAVFLLFHATVFAPGDERNSAAEPTARVSRGYFYGRAEALRYAIDGAADADIFERQAVVAARMTILR